MLHFLRLLIQITLAPRNGWEDVETEDPDPRTIFYTGFVPLTAVSALSVLFKLVYHPYLSVLLLFEKSLIQFVAMFVTYYLGEFFFSLYLLRNIRGSLQPDRMRLYLMMSLSVMSLMLMIINMVPFSPVLMLLPLYVVVVMRMSTDYLSVARGRTGHFMLLSMSALFAPPLIIMFIFGYLTRQTL